MLARFVVFVLLAAAAAAAIECETSKLCNNSEECGKDGYCLGAFVGKCNCNACMTFWTCQNDAACGGLRGACDLKTNRCKCWEALESLGYPFLRASTELCNSKQCFGQESNCFGLPCNVGRCVCKAKN
ncbi:hypothetical protein PRIPAC_71941 [Pristionchus pacificus]|uniref:Uncharacterized protein n=1 Tax=Pristionchus pacificus TaxID=54126 RepID=A0A454XWA9_PRIPA|nr:hypothetical protein PRIPAC_71941 [Pristionchus pacificus]|eukprot:PDM71728.1 hypothetical protein PRIPAC_38135 [Pristionchus pacificus]